MNHLGLFAKFWQPGTVKTRLAVKVGNAAACELYRRFVFHLLQRLEQTGDGRTVVFSPPDRQSDVENQIPNSWATKPQSDGDLGSRMKSFFEGQFEQLQKPTVPSESPVDKIVVIGADCPQLTADDLDGAFEALNHSSVVLGPSTDGGYYLIGMKNECIDLFQNVQWSTDQVLEQTIEILESQGVGFQLLRPMTDIDELDDLVRLKKDLEQAEKILDQLDLDLLSSIQNTCAYLHDEEATVNYRSQDQ